VTINRIENRLVKNRINLTEAIVADSSGSLKVVWFNQPFLTQTIKVGDELYLAGQVEFAYNTLSMNSPTFEKVTPDEPVHAGRIVPIYPETAGVTSRFLRSKIKLLVKYIYSIKDYLPNSVKEAVGLIDLPAAIRQMHFPENNVQLKRAQDRLDFDEMFFLEMAVLDSRKSLNKERSIAIPYDEELIKKFIQNLPFELTNAQKKAAWDIIQDLTKDSPMNRLVQGDVGSGKTVVAAMAMANVAASGAQAALLCPTEILAKQHYAKMSELLKPLGFEVVLLTAGTSKDERINNLVKIRDGEARIIVGTHAVLEKKVEFWRLALAIVDEQHRFGVEQRASLRKESLSTNTLPHFLAMSATPIPRTLSLTFYGDLDVSVINELPTGRKKVVTKLVPGNHRKEAYLFIEEELKRGHQAFVVCPLVNDKKSEMENEEENESVTDKLQSQNISQSAEDERKSVLSEYEKLSGDVFKNYNVAYIHGQMKTGDKELVMSKFISGEVKVLVASSVIEVGVDVPNATIMIIEDADRFGLAQLHQFRGRVGRGSAQAYCFLFTGTKNEDSLKRLTALTHTHDGFKLAGIDLEIRGPGDFIGSRQHGLPDIKMRNLTNLELIEKCRRAAANFLADNDVNDYPLLKKHLGSFSKVLRLE
jgi:ATP-dependent DNA helicase RecG